MTMKQNSEPAGKTNRSDDEGWRRFTAVNKLLFKPSNQQKHSTTVSPNKTTTNNKQTTKQRNEETQTNSTILPSLLTWHWALSWNNEAGSREGQTNQPTNKQTIELCNRQRPKERPNKRRSKQRHEPTHERLQEVRGGRTDSVALLKRVRFLVRLSSLLLLTPRESEANHHWSLVNKTHAKKPTIQAGRML